VTNNNELKYDVTVLNDKIILCQNGRQRVTSWCVASNISAGVSRHDFVSTNSSCWWEVVTQRNDISINTKCPYVLAWLSGWQVPVKKLKLECAGALKFEVQVYPFTCLCTSSVFCVLSNYLYRSKEFIFFYLDNYSTLFW